MQQLSSGITSSQRDHFAAQMIYEWFAYTELEATVPSNMGKITHEKDACHIRATKIMQWYPEFGRSERMKFMTRLWKLLPKDWREVLTAEHKDSDRGVGHRRKAASIGISEQEFRRVLSKAYSHIQDIWDKRREVMI